MTESIVAVFKTETQSTVILRIVDPRSRYQPDWVKSTFTSNEKKHWTTFFEKCVIHKISLYLYTQNTAKC